MSVYEQLALLYVEKNAQPGDSPEKLISMYRYACVNGIYYPAVLIPVEVSHTVHKSKNEITDTHSEYSITFPIVLTGRFATSGYVFFSLPQETVVPSAKIFSLKVCTNNGTAVEKLLELSDPQ